MSSKIPPFFSFRASAPLSFWNHAAFMKACARNEALRFAIVAALLACAFTTCDAVSAIDAQGVHANTVPFFIHEVLPTPESVGESSSPLINVANCSVLESAPAGFNMPSANPFSTNAEWSFFPEPARSTLHHANWRIHYWDSWKLIENTLAGGQYQLIMRGSDPASIPTLVAGQIIPVPDGTDEAPIVISNDLRVFTIPIDRVCVEETIGLSFVEMLGLRMQITMLGQYSTPTSQCVQEMNLPFLESEYGNLTKREAQVKAHCDLVLGSNDAGPPGEKQHVSFAATEDSSLLARSEWIKFVAAFFNRELAADDIYSGVNLRYDATALRVLADQAPGQPLPVVAWISQYDGTYSFSTAAYKANFTRDAGGQIFAPATVNFKDIKEFHKVLQSSPISVVIDESYAFDPTSYTMATFVYNFQLVNNATTEPNFNVSTLPFMMEKQVYRYDGLIAPTTFALDWFENAIPNADALLADLGSILADNDPVLKNHTEVWFRNIAQGATCRYTSTECPDKYAPLPAIEAAEGSPANDPSMVAACPQYLMEPWTYVTNNPGKPSRRLSAIAITFITLACLIVLIALTFVVRHCVDKRRLRDEDAMLSTRLHNVNQVYVP